MNKLSGISVVLAVYLVGGFFSSAHAGVPVVFGSGERIHDIKSLPDTEMSVGYLQKSFTIFWMPVAQWDGKFVLYKGDRYLELPANVPLSAVSKPFLAYVPWGWFVLGPILLLWIGAKSK